MNEIKKSTFFSSSLLWPKMASLSSAAWLVRPSLLHLRFSKTSSMGMFSCIHKHKKNKNKNTQQSKKITKKQQRTKKRVKWFIRSMLPNQQFPSTQHPTLQVLLPSFNSLSLSLSLYNNKNKAVQKLWEVAKEIQLNKKIKKSVWLRVGIDRQPNCDPKRRDPEMKWNNNNHTSQPRKTTKHKPTIIIIM